jgi:hypothetical protein
VVRFPYKTRAIRGELYANKQHRSSTPEDSVVTIHHEDPQGNRLRSMVVHMNRAVQRSIFGFVKATSVLQSMWVYPLRGMHYGDGAWYSAGRKELRMFQVNHEQRVRWWSTRTKPCFSFSLTRGAVSKRVIIEGIRQSARVSERRLSNVNQI